MPSYKSYEELLEDALSYGKQRGVDTRQGSIYFDAIAGHCLRTAKFYEDLKLVADLVLLDTATGDELDSLGKEHGLIRHEATCAQWSFAYEGSKPPEGTRFFIDMQYFTCTYGDTPVLVSEQPGTKANSLAPGLACIPAVTVGGMTKAVLGKIVSYGTETEIDEDFRQRLREKIAGPAENGNRQHYKTWCESVAGVGRARIFPLWDGDNTVKGVIIGANGKPPGQGLIDEVQDYVDPGSTGLGEGVANIGSRFTAVAAKAQEINVSIKLELLPGWEVGQVREAAAIALEKELSRLSLQSPDGEAIIIRVTWVGSMIGGLQGVVDYSDLSLNGAESNIVISEESVPILGEVEVASVSIRQ